jgi:glycosyltransferase involved in cell wall biosynthesis
MRVAGLITEAHGGRGGIAAYNRELLDALAAHPRCARVIVVARHGRPVAAGLHPKLAYAGGGGKARFLLDVARAFGPRGRACDLVVCGHLNLLPAAWAVARRHGAPLVLFVHGIEAWQPHRSALVNRLARRVDDFVAVSELTRRRFQSWSGVDAAGRVLHGCVDLAAFAPGPKRRDLLERLGLGQNTVLMTMARLCAAERYKGVDEVLEALPALAAEVPDVAYLVCGDGDDLARLRAKAHALGVAGRVVFAGYVPEQEKADYYRLADAFVMPSRGEGFGIVYLEALACGVPVVGGRDDGGREALRGGAWGELVDPSDAADVAGGIRAALARGAGALPRDLSDAGRAAFVGRVGALVDALGAGGERG